MYSVSVQLQGLAGSYLAVDEEVGLNICHFEYFVKSFESKERERIKIVFNAYKPVLLRAR